MKNLLQSALKANVVALMKPPKSKSRKKAIITISKKRNTSRENAQLKQAIRIAYANVKAGKTQ